MTSLSRDFAAFLARVRFEDLPARAIEDAHRATLDWLGSAMAGSLEKPARSAQRTVASLGASKESTVFSSPRASALGAALANGIASHILELDDVHKGSTLHAGAPVISAALAVAERERASGPEFLRAVVLGYEAALRVGEAINPSHYRYWHPTGTAATFGAAIAAASLLNLNAAQTLDALGSAGTQAAGLWEFNADGAMSKHLHPGKAAFNGVLSAELARDGFTGASRILEGERGFFRATTTAFDSSRVTAGLGKSWKISENAYKVWSCCGHTHTAIDIAADLRARLGWKGRDAALHVQAVEIDTYAAGYEIVKQMNPASPYQAKFSLAYVVAAALLTGGAGLDAFGEERFTADGVSDPDTAALLSRTRVSVADDLTAKYPSAWGSRVLVRLDDGTELKGAADHAVGNPENPVSTERLEQKFKALILPRFGAPAAESGIAAVRSLANQTDMSAVFSDLAPPHE
jgi:2-methylcitrate dehydratase PrpD